MRQVRRPSKLEKRFIDKMMQHSHQVSSLLRAHFNGIELKRSHASIALAPFNTMRREIYWKDGSQSRLDFGWPTIKLGIEIQGGIFGERRKSLTGHATRAGFIRDYAKFNALQLAGWRVLLFTPEDVSLTKRWQSYTLPLLVEHLVSCIISTSR